jgi:hypothetical protein
MTLVFQRHPSRDSYTLVSVQLDAGTYWARYFREDDDNQVGWLTLEQVRWFLSRCEAVIIFSEGEVPLRL